MDINTIEEKENLITLSNEEQKQKIFFDFVYLKSKIEDSTTLQDKEKKIIESLSKKFEKDLENILEITITSKEKKSFLNLKKSNLDSKLTSLLKFI